MIDEDQQSRTDILLSSPQFYLLLNIWGFAGFSESYFEADPSLIRITGEFIFRNVTTQYCTDCCQTMRRSLRFLEPRNARSSAEVQMKCDRTNASHTDELSLKSSVVTELSLERYWVTSSQGFLNNSITTNEQIWGFNNTDIFNE